MRKYLFLILLSWSVVAQAKRPTPYNVFEFGAKGDGVTDDSAAIQRALTAAQGTTLRFSAGTYKCLGNLVVSGSIDIQADNAIITFAGSSTKYLDIAGTVSALPALSTTLNAGSDSVSFSSAHGLAIGDVFTVCNTNAFSYSPYRSEYHQGEYFKVREVTSGTQVKVTSAAYATYSISGTVNTKLNGAKVVITGLTVVGAGSVGAPAVKISYATQSRIERCNFSGSLHSGLYMQNCYDSSVDQFDCIDIQTPVGLNYGIIVGNSQRINLSNIRVFTTRHGVSFGGTESIAAVPCREIHISDSVIGGGGPISGGVPGLNFHGNCEWTTVVNCTFPNGANFAGNHSSWIGCTFINDVLSGYGLADQAEPSGSDHQVIGCHFKAVQDFTGGLLAFYPRSEMTNAGMFKVDGCDFDLGTFTGPDGALIFYPTIGSSGVGTTNNLVSIVGNTFTGGSAATNTYGINLRSFHGFAIKQAHIADNNLNGTGIRVQNDIGELTIVNNTIRNAAECGIIMGNTALSNIYTTPTFKIEGNHIYKSASTGIRLFPQAGAVWSIRGNTVLSSAQTPIGSSYDSSIYVSGGNIASLEDNVLGDFDAHQQVVLSMDSLGTLHRLRNTFVGVQPTNQITFVTNDFRPVSGQMIYQDSWARQLSTTNLWWDGAYQGLAIGPGSYGDYSVPLYVRRQTNALISAIFQNDIALGNTSAGMAVQVYSKDSSGGLRAYPSDYGNPLWRDSVGIFADGSATNLMLSAENAGQVITLRSTNVYSTATNTAPEFVASTAITLGGTRRTTWPTGTGSANITDSGTNIIVQGTVYATNFVATDLNGFLSSNGLQTVAATAPLFIGVSGTNATVYLTNQTYDASNKTNMLVTGNVLANGGAFTNTLTLNGVAVLTNSAAAIAGTVINTSVTGPALLAVQADKTNGTAATAAMITTTLGYTPQNGTAVLTNIQTSLAGNTATTNLQVIGNLTANGVTATNFSLHPNVTASKIAVFDANKYLTNGTVAESDLATVSYVNSIVSTRQVFYPDLAASMVATTNHLLSTTFPSTLTTVTSNSVATDSYPFTFLSTNYIPILEDGVVRVDADFSINAGACSIRPEIYVATNNVGYWEASDATSQALTTTRAHYSWSIIVQTNAPITNQAQIFLKFKVISQTSSPNLTMYSGSNAISVVEIPSPVALTSYQPATATLTNIQTALAANSGTTNLLVIGGVQANYVKITNATASKIAVIDGTGIITNGTVAEAGLQTALGYTPVNKAGDTMSGTLTVTGLTNSALTGSRVVLSAADKSLTSSSMAIGDLSLNQTYKNIWIDAGAMTPQESTKPSADTFAPASGVLTNDVLGFDSGGGETARFRLLMPDDWDLGTIKAKFVWSAATTNTVTNVCIWGISAFAYTNSMNISTNVFGTEVTTYQASANTQTVTNAIMVTPATAAMTVNYTPYINNPVYFKVVRNAGGAATNLYGDAQLHGVQLQYKTLTTQPAIW